VASLQGLRGLEGGRGNGPGTLQALEDLVACDRVVVHDVEPPEALGDLPPNPFKHFN
jgi:hypothetical protein